MPGPSSGPARPAGVLLAILVTLVYPVAPAAAIECRNSGSGTSAVDQYCDPFGDVNAAGGGATAVSADVARRARRLGRDGTAVLRLVPTAGAPARGAAGPASAAGHAARGRRGRRPTASTPPAGSRSAGRRPPPVAAATGPVSPTAETDLMAILGTLGVIVLALGGLDARRRRSAGRQDIG